MFTVTKTYGHERGYSCCFRQPRAQSHCRHLHGYALAFELTIGADELDENNWVFDFGALKPFKAFLDANFDHKTLIAEDDPHLEAIMFLADADAADVLVLEKIGCEAFAEYVGRVAAEIVANAVGNRCRVVSMRVAEHGSNCATWFNPK